MKKLAEIIEKHPFWFIAIVFLLPSLLALGMYIPVFSLAKGEANAWLGFWGSYLGGLVSGLLTFAGVYFAFKLQEDKNKVSEERQKTIEIFRNYKDVFTVFMWCEDMIKYLDGRYEWDTQRVFEITDKARESYKALLVIDVVWFKKFQDLFGQSFEKTSIINTYGLERFRELNKDTFKKEIEKVHLEILEYIKVNL